MNDRPASPTQRPAAYVLSHWRGELSLARSFWVNNVLLNVLAGGVIGAVQNAPWQDLELQASSAVWLLGAMIIVPISVWQVVGVWRAAARQLRLTGRRLWPRLAQAAMVIGVLQFAAQAQYYLPALKEHMEIALGLDEPSRYAMAVVYNGQILRIDGGIGSGLTRQVGRMLEQHPGVVMVQLESTGGWIYEAHRLRLLIEQRRLATLTEGLCLSACTVAFLGGEDRYMTVSAEIGFHRPYFPGLPRYLRDQQLLELRDFYLGKGLPRDFVERVVQTSHEAMWLPHPQELLDAGVVHGVVED